MLKGLRIKVKGDGTVEVYPEFAGKRGSSLRRTDLKQTAKTAGEAVQLVLSALSKQ